MVALFAMPASAAVRFVVAVGNDVGLAVEEPLRWAETDAGRVRDVMVELGGVTTSRAVTLLGAGPDEVERALWIVRGQVDEARRRGDRTELVLSYSGHGDRGQLHLGGELLGIDRLLGLIDEVGADATIVILDACRSGPVRSGRARGASPGPGFTVQLVDELAPKGRVVLSSASDGEVAQESDDLEGAFFTHHLLAGLRGAADGDGDGDVGLAELYGYAWARTLSGSFAGAPVVQHPELKTTLTGQGELTLTRLERSPATLLLDGGLTGRFLIADARSGRVIVELEKVGPAPLRLAVPARRLRVMRRAGHSTSVAEVDVVRGSTTTLLPTRFVEAPRLAGRSRGGDVDVTPWGILAGPQVLTSTTLPPGAPATGGSLLVERRVGDAPVFVGVQVALARAGGGVAGGSAVTGVDDVVFAELGGRLLVPVVFERWSPIGRLTGGVVAGVEGIWQQIARTDGARLAAAGFDVPLRREHLALAPLLAARGGLFVPVVGGVGVGAILDVGGTTHVLDGALRPLPHISLMAGAGAEF